MRRWRILAFASAAVALALAALVVASPPPPLHATFGDTRHLEIHARANFSQSLEWIGTVMASGHGQRAAIGVAERVDGTHFTIYQGNTAHLTVAARSWLNGAPAGGGTQIDSAGGSMSGLLGSNDPISGWKNGANVVRVVVNVTSVADDGTDGSMAIDLGAVTIG